MIKLTNEQIETAAQLGEKQAAGALSALSKKNITVTTKESRVVPASDAAETFSKIKDESVIAYMQAITGVTGLSVLSLDREDALELVDLLNDRDIGTTRVMQEIDRSTIKETLNILANSYATELTKLTNESILLNVPKIITRDRISEISKTVGSSEEGFAVIFDTELSVGASGLVIELYFFFLTNTGNGDI